MAIKTQCEGSTCSVRAYDEVEVEVPENFLGDVMDLNSRRGQVKAWVLNGRYCKVTAKVPLAEMFGYATDIRSKTQGRGIFAMEFSHYEEVPRNVAEAIILQRKRLTRKVIITWHAQSLKD